MNILDQIVADKRVEVVEKKKLIPAQELKKSTFYNRNCYSLKQFLLDKNRTGIIAEFKRKSPSKGIFNKEAKPEIITKAYTDNGASGLSVLTDEKYFAGSNDDLKAARSVNNIPILRKDFVIDEYQITEAKAIGADVILLIAECLSKEEIHQFSVFAKSLGLEILLEIHSAVQLEKISPAVDLVGINNRDLTTFTVDINRSLELIKLIPAQFLKVAESGISRAETILQLKQAGFHGFLIGENFMKQKNPGEAFKEFVADLQLRSSKSPDLEEDCFLSLTKNKLNIKVCGITSASDLQQLTTLKVHYAGLIFYENSPRFLSNKLSAEEAKSFSGKIKKAGVFVNAGADEIRQKIKEYELDAVQLHGDESPELCRELQTLTTVIKALRINEQTEINALTKPFEAACDYFLFDAAGENYGGNGINFNWKILASYDGDIPFFLSGGIALEHSVQIKDFIHPKLFAIDINSRFEMSPGKKNIDLIKTFLCELDI